MIAPNLIWILSISFFGLVSLTLVSFILFSLIKKSDLSIFRNFPYEFANKGNQELAIYRPFLYVLCIAAFTPLFFITPLSAEFGDFAFLTIFVTCVFGLATIANMLLFFFDARYTKTHMVLVTVSMCLSLLSNGLTTLLGVLLFKNYHDRGVTYLPSLIIAILAFVFVLAVLVLIFNPKLTKWAKLETNKDSNGEVTVSRGKIFILAFSEWLTIFLTTLGELLFFLVLIK